MWPIKTKLWHEETENRLRELVAEGKSARQIGGEFGCTRNAILGKCHRLGLTLKGAHYGTGRPLKYETMTAEELEIRGLMRRKNKADRQRRWYAKQRGRAASGTVLPPVKVIDLPPSGKVSFRDLGHGQCRFIAGPVDGAETLYCGGPAIFGGPWCSGHYRVVHAI